MEVTHVSSRDEPVEGTVLTGVLVKVEKEDEFGERVDLGSFDLSDIYLINSDEEMVGHEMSGEFDVPDSILCQVALETPVGVSPSKCGKKSPVSSSGVDAVEQSVVVAEVGERVVEPSVDVNNAVEGIVEASVNVPVAEGSAVEPSVSVSNPGRDVESSLDETSAAVSFGEPTERAMDEMSAAMYLEQQIEGNLAYIKEHRTPATEKKTKQNVKRLQLWLAEKHNEARPIEQIPPRELDVYIGAFFISAKIEKGKRAGELYEPDTLTAMHRCFERHLKDCNYPVLITKDGSFSTSREVLSSRRKDLKKMGKGNKPNKAEYLSDDDMEQFWRLGLLGYTTPAALIHSLFVFFVMGFGMRPNHGSHQLKWGDVTLKSEKDMHGQTRRYLEWNERLTKTRAGQLDDGVRAFPPKVYDVAKDNFARCPVRAYELYASRRPPHCMEKEDPFFLGINQHATKDSAVWYVNMQMGINTIIHIMPVMAQKAGLPGKITNYSLRRTMCTNLLNQNVPVNLITQVSGHKSIESLNHYAVASRSQQRAMSSITVGGNRPACRALSNHPELPNSSSSLPEPTHDIEEMGNSVTVKEPASSACPGSTASAVTVGIDNASERQVMLRRLLNEVRPSIAIKITGHRTVEELMAEAYPEKSTTGVTRHESSGSSAESLVKGMLAGAHVQGNVAINVHYSMSNMGRAVTLSPQVPRPALE